MTDPASALKEEMASTWHWRIDTDPELAASLDWLASRRSKHDLDPRSPESFAKRLEWVEKALTRIQAIDNKDLSKLSKADHLSCQLYLAQLADYAEYLVPVVYTKKHKTFCMRYDIRYRSESRIIHLCVCPPLHISYPFS